MVPLVVKDVHGFHTEAMRGQIFGCIFCTFIRIVAHTVTPIRVYQDCRGFCKNFYQEKCYFRSSTKNLQDNRQKSVNNFIMLTESYYRLK